MASSDTPTRILESPSVLHAEINQRLEEDQINPQCSVEEKLFYIWRLYQNAENDLVAATEKQEQLKRSQADEMQEVESYVEHIRHLSDEREALIQDLETENDQLKQDIERFRQEQNSSALRDETAEMLIQQDLQEIAQAPTSEQIAFLLVERARLLDELEAEQGRSLSALSDGRVSEELQKQIECEREEIQGEMQQQREAAKSEVELLKHEHEEEISVVMDENQRLEQELAASKHQVKELEAKLKEMDEDRKKEKEQYEKEKEGFVNQDEEGEALSPLMSSLVSPRYPRVSPKQRPPSPARSANDVALRQIIGEKTKLEGEILGYKSKIRNLENDILILKQQVSNVEKQNEESEMKMSQLQMKNKSLKAELDDIEQQLEDSETQIEELKKEKESLHNTLDAMSTEFGSLKSDVVRINSLNETIENLNVENKDLTSQVESLKQELHNVVAEKDYLANQKLELSKSEVKLSYEIHELKSELNILKTAKDEFSNQKSQLIETQAMLDSKTIEYNQLFNDSEKMNKENKELLNRMAMLQNELESIKKETQVVAKQELITGHMRDQNIKLTKEVEELQAKLTLKENKLEEITKQHKKEVEDLKAKLQLTLNELSKAKSLIEQERNENTELTSRILELEQQLDDVSKASDGKTSSLEEMEERVREMENILSEKSTLEKELVDQKRQTITLQDEIDEHEAMKNELEDCQDMLDQEKRTRMQLEKKLMDVEQQFEDQKIEHDNIQQTLLAKVKTLENRVQALQDDLFAAQDELQSAQENYEKANEESRAAKVELQERLMKEEHRSMQAVAKLDEVDVVDQRLETQKLENLQKQMASLKARVFELQNYTDAISNERDSLQREIKLLRETEKKFSSKSEDNEIMRNELDAVRRELEHLRASAQYNDDERQQHLNKIRTLDDYVQQLQLDNRELANKLQEILVKFEQSEESIKREKRETIDRQHQKSRQLTQVESDLTMANNRIRELQEELQKKQNHVVKLESDKVGQSTKLDSSIAKVEAELNELKTYHRKEMDRLTSKSEQSSKEIKELKNQLREKDQEILSKHHEMKKIKIQLERLEVQLQTEVKIKTDFENRNTSLDQDISKIWSQVRTLMEKNSSLETAKRSLEEELERKNSTVRQAETSYIQSKVNHEATIKVLQSYADAADRRAANFQRELQETSVQLQTLQSQVNQAESRKLDLLDKTDRMVQLKNQLDSEKLQRNLLDQTVRELQQQVSMLRQRESKVLEQNRELQHTRLDLEVKLEELQDHNQTALEMQQHMSDVGKRSMVEQIAKLQKDIKDLQYQLLTVNERREILDRKIEERKVRTRTKLLKAREFYMKEKHRVQDQLNRMDEDLRLTRATLRKELDWKDKMDANYKQLISEKRELLSQLSEMEETVREKSRNVSILQLRTKYLEEENAQLQERINCMDQQKHGLDKLLKEQKLGKDRENSLIHPHLPRDNRHGASVSPTRAHAAKHFTSMFEPKDTVDTLLDYRTRRYEPMHSVRNIGYIGNSYMSDSCLASMGESLDPYGENNQTRIDIDYEADDFDV